VSLNCDLTDQLGQPGYGRTPTRPRPRTTRPPQAVLTTQPVTSTFPVLILPASLSCRHDSCRSFRRLPFSVGRGGHRLIRRQCGASIPHHTTSYNNHPSIQRQSVSQSVIHPSTVVITYQSSSMVPTWGHGGRAPPRRSSSHRVKVSPPGRRSPFASGEMPVALSLRNLPREEAPLAFPGYTALRELLPAHGAHRPLPTLRASAKGVSNGKGVARRVHLPIHRTPNHQAKRAKAPARI